MTKRDVRFHAIALAVAVLVSLIETWPLATRLTTHYLALNPEVTEDPDELLTSWILASDVHLLARDPLHVFDANNLHPFRRSLAFSENLLGLAALVWPVQVLWDNPALTHNVALLVSLSLTAYGVTLLVHEMSGSLTAGLVAATFATYTPVIRGNITQLHLAAGQWTPIALFALARLVRTGRWRWSVVLGVTVAWQLWTSLHWGVFLALGLVAGVPVLLILSRGARSALPQIAVAALIGAALVIPLVIEYQMFAREMDLHERGFAAFLWPFQPLPPLDHPLAFIAQRLSSGARLSTVSTLAPWLAAAGGTMGGLFVRRPRVVDVPMVAAVAAGALVNWWYALGFISLHGLPSLYRLLNDVPGMGILRCPVRAVFYFCLMVSVLGGCGLAVVLRHLPGRLARGAVVAALLLLTTIEAGWRDLPLLAAPPRRTSIVEAVRELPPDCAIAELPSDWDRAALALFRTTVHWRPILNGRSGFYPVSVFLESTFLQQFPNQPALDYLRAAGVCAVILHLDNRWGRAMRDESALRKLEFRVQDGEALVHLPSPPAEHPDAPLLGRERWRIVEPANAGGEMLDNSLETVRRFAVEGDHGPERLTVDLGGAADVSGIDLELGSHFRLFIVTYTIEGSLDGAEWRTIAEAPTAVPPFESYRSDPSHTVQRIRFPMTSVRFLRLRPYRTPPKDTLAADVGFNSWGIAELQVHGTPVD